jgi:hypothetical protein
LGVIAFFPCTCGSSIAWLKYRSDAAADPAPATATELMEARPGWHDLYRVELTLDGTATMEVEGERGERGTLVRVDEDPRFLLLIGDEDEVEVGHQSHVVHRDNHVFIVADSRLQERFGVSRDEAEIFVSEDTRDMAGNEATFAGWFALIAAIIGTLGVTSGSLALRMAGKQEERRPRAESGPPPTPAR